MQARTFKKTALAAVALAMLAVLPGACDKGGPLCDLGAVGCPDVGDGTTTWTCTYDGVEGTGESECMATWSLMFALCDSGSMATEDEVRAGMECTEGDTGAP